MRPPSFAPPLAWLIALAALLIPRPALATGDVLSFATDAGMHTFIVYNGADTDGWGGVVVCWPSVARRDLPPAALSHALDRSSGHLRVRFTNPGDATSPPSFVIAIDGRTGRLSFAGRTYPGQAHWRAGPFAEPWSSDARDLARAARRRTLPTSQPDPN